MERPEMSLIFPRDMTDLARWKEPHFELMFRQELARDAGGPTQAKDLGPALWQASFVSVPLQLADADAVMSEFRSLRGAARSFFLYLPTRARPAASGDLSGSTVTVGSVRGDSGALRLTGLPASFEMTSGDFISVATAAGGVELVQVVQGGQASVAGLSPELEVIPYIRPSVAAGDAVALVNPVGEFILQPGTLEDPYAGLSHRRISFTAVQVVR